MYTSSLYQHTKNSIQQGILDLQQKIRKRKQLQYQKYIDDQNILNSQKLYQYQLELAQLGKVYDEAKYTPLLPNPNYVNYYDPFYKNLIPKDPLSLTIQQIKQKIKQQTFHLQYLKRLQKIKKENQIQSQKIDIELIQKQKLLLQQQLQKINKNTNKSNQATLKQYNYDFELKNRQNQKINSLQNKQGQRLKNIQNPLFQKSNKYQHQNKIVDSYQYEQPYQQDSSILVQKYNKGVKAEQYYKDMKKLDDLEERLKNINQIRTNINSKKYNNISQRLNESLIKSNYQTPKQFKRSPKKSPQKTIQKNHIPIIKQDIQESVQTVTNSANKNKIQNKPNKNKVQTSQFLNEKIKFVINSQQKENRKNKFKNRLNSQRKFSNKEKNNLSNLGKTIDTIGLHRYDKYENSPIKRIRNNSQRTYVNPYIKISNKIHSRSKQNKSAVFHKKNRSISQINNRNVTAEICIPALLYPQSQKIKYQQTFNDKIAQNCIQKIQKRLKISTIVFKDSKLRNNKYEIDHLWHKFENQIKGRKQIKDKINTNPRILKKHKMVVN